MSNVEERYARAIRTSHLEVEDAPGDVDQIIAAGLAEPLGVLLSRLRTEWDTVSPKEIASAADSLTARVLILMNLRSLPQAKQAMLNFSLAKAESKGCASDAKALGALVGKVMDVWLDRLCHPCEGRGFNGGRGTPRLECRHCRGSGSRRMGQLSQVNAEHHFGLWLLNVMDSKCSGSMGQMARKTRRDE